ncbi:MAG: hypothetical protein A2176_01590 [Spirochaetes bacterium RBG_13_51_14]|nr:MAG: hypothetical protein A2176_01590 [Spirochaetes bacterium RBG_13_51_14]
MAFLTANGAGLFFMAILAEGMENHHVSFAYMAPGTFFLFFIFLGIVVAYDATYGRIFMYGMGLLRKTECPRVYFFYVFIMLIINFFFMTFIAMFWSFFL